MILSAIRFLARYESGSQVSEYKKVELSIFACRISHPTKHGLFSGALVFFALGSAIAQEVPSVIPSQSPDSTFHRSSNLALVPVIVRDYKWNAQIGGRLLHLMSYWKTSAVAYGLRGSPISAYMVVRRTGSRCELATESGGEYLRAAPEPYTTGFGRAATSHN